MFTAVTYRKKNPMEASDKEAKMEIENDIKIDLSRIGPRS
jgi:hypothetical protein